MRTITMNRLADVEDRYTKAQAVGVVPTDLLDELTEARRSLSLYGA